MLSGVGILRVFDFLDVIVWFCMICLTWVFDCVNPRGFGVRVVLAGFGLFGFWCCGFVCSRRFVIFGFVWVCGFGWFVAPWTLTPFVG